MGLSRDVDRLPTERHGESHKESIKTLTIERENALALMTGLQ